MNFALVGLYVAISNVKPQKIHGRPYRHTLKRTVIIDKKPYMASANQPTYGTDI